jgi:hypothetical protein
MSRWGVSYGGAVQLACGCFHMLNPIIAPLDTHASNGMSKFVYIDCHKPSVIYTPIVSIPSAYQYFIPHPRYVSLLLISFRHL